MPLKRNSSSLLREIESYLIVSFGMLLYAFAWVGVLIPAKVVGGGVNGIGMLIYYATGGEQGGIPIAVSYFAINAVLLIIALIVIGPRFGIKTIYAMAFLTAAMAVMPLIIPANFMGITHDKLLSAILGGAIGGSGIGITFSQGGSTGGTDIIALIVNKYKNVSLGRVIVLCDMVIVGCSFFVFHEMQAIVYGYVTLVISGFTIDTVISGNKQSAQITIISKNYSQIAERITSETGRGVTMLEGVGWYTKNQVKVLLVTCRRNETSTLYRIIKDCDPDSFITMGSVMGVYGKGFEALKI